MKTKTIYLILAISLLLTSTQTNAAWNLTIDSIVAINTIQSNLYGSYSGHPGGTTMIVPRYDTSMALTRSEEQIYLSALDTAGQFVILLDSCVPGNLHYGKLTYLGDSVGLGFSNVVTWTTPCNPITISGGMPDTIFIGVGPVPGGFSVSGGISPYVYSLLNGPTGVTVNDSVGLFNGTPSVLGNFIYTGIVTDVVGCQDSLVDSTIVLCNQITVATTLSADTFFTGDVLDGNSVTASGGTSPYAYSYSGNLISGIEMSLGGVLSDTIDAVGNYNFYFVATDAAGCKDSLLQNKIVVCPSLSITSPLVAYSDTLFVGSEITGTGSVSGGAVPYQWNTSLDFPTGLSWSIYGDVDDTVEVSGTYSYVYYVTDKYNCQDSLTESKTVLCPLQAMNYLNKTWHVGQTDSAVFTVSGGTMPYSWNISGLPLNLLPNSNTNNPIPANSNMIGGYTTAAGNTPIVVVATDYFGCSMTHLDTIKSICDTIFVTTTISDSLIVGNTYNATISATNGNSPYSYSWTNEPTGLNLVGNAIVDTAEAAGSFSTTFSVVDTFGCPGNLVKNIVVSCPDITILGLAGVVVGKDVSYALTISGGTAPYSSTVSGNLPTGWSWTGDSVVGVASVVGTFEPITLQTTDHFGCPGITIDTVEIFCNQTLFLNSLVDGTTGVFYEDTILTDDPFATISLDSGSVASGLSFVGGGIVMGLPDSAGSYIYTLSALNGYGCVSTTTDTMLTICPSISISSNLIDTLYLGQVPNASVSASGGTGPYTYSWGGDTIPGVTLSSNGVFGDTANQLGNFVFVYYARDFYNCVDLKADTLITLCSNPVIVSPFGDTITTGSVALDTVAVADSLGLSHTYSYLGNFVSGLVLSPNGAVSDTASLNGAYIFTLKVINNWGCIGMKSDTVIVVCPNIVIDPLSDNWIIGTSGSDTLSASGGSSPYTWSTTTLPQGLTRTDSVISGTPGSDGDYTIAVTAIDKFGCSKTQLDTISIDSLWSLKVLSVDSIGADSALLFVLSRDNHDANAYAFAGFGTNGLTIFTSNQSVPLGDDTLVFLLNSLLPGTTYLAGARGVDSSGLVATGTITFTTDLTGPQILSAIVQNILPTGADILVTVSTGGANTTVVVYCDNNPIPTTSYTSTTAGNGVVPFHVYNLADSAMAYLYAVAYNAYGTDTILVDSFMTPGYSVSATLLSISCNIGKIDATVLANSNDSGAIAWLVYDVGTVIGQFPSETDPEVIGVTNSQILLETSSLGIGSEYTVLVKTRTSSGLEKTSNTKTCTITDVPLVVLKDTKVMMTGQQLRVWTLRAGNIRITDCTGREVVFVSVASGENSIPLQLPTAVYIYSLSVGENILTGKIFVQQ